MPPNDETTGAETARKPSAKAETKATPDPVTVQVRVLKHGLTIAGCRVAKGAVLYCNQATAEFHEKRGEATILGTA